MLLCAVSLALGACASPTIPDPCAGWHPIRPVAEDKSAVSGELARQIVAHNNFGRANCGWQK